MEYDKPHLTFETQVSHLRARGMECADEAEAARVLSRMGYYRDWITESPWT